MPLQIRRGPTLDREDYTPLIGELVYDTTTGAVYVGDGETAGGTSVSNFTPEDAADAVAAVLAAGTHSGITFEYQDSLNKINATVGGTVVATIRSEGNVLLVDSVLGSINLDGTVKGHITPAVNSTYDLGTDSFKFRDLYLSGSSIHLGTAVITAPGTWVDLPAGSLVGGIPISASSNGDGVVPGSNYNINIIGDDSTMILNSSLRSLVANVTGNTTGFHSGNVTGNLLGNVTGNSTGYHTGDVKGSVFGDDSSLIVDAIGGNLYGALTGNVRGSVIGAGAETLVDAVSNTIFARVEAPSLTVTGQAQVICVGGNFLTVEGQAASGSTTAQMSIKGTRYSGEAYAAVQNNDTLANITFDGYNGTTFKKAVLLSSTVNSTITGAGAFDNTFSIRVLNQGNAYQQFGFSGYGVFTTLSVGFTPLTSVQIGSVTPFEGGLVYNTDVNRLQLYTGAAFESLATFVTVPSTSSSAGFKGQYSADANYAYICYDTNLWIRVAKSAW